MVIFIALVSYKISLDAEFFYIGLVLLTMNDFENAT